MKSIKHNAIMNGILSIMTIIFPLITFPYVSRILGVEANGRLSFANSVITYFSLFASLGISTYGIRACAKKRENKNELSKTVHELLFINLITTIIVFLVLIFSIIFIPKLNVEFKLLFIYSLNMILNIAGLNWLYSGIENYDYITIRSIAFKIISLILMFIFVHKPEDMYIYACITVFATVGSNILNMINARKYIDYKWIGNYNIKQHIKPTLALFVTSLAINVYTNLDNVMLGFSTNDYQVGIYNTSVKIKSVITSLVTSLGAVLLPRLSNYIENKNKEEFYKVLNKSFAFTSAVAFPLVIYFFIFAKESVLFISGTQYLDSVIPMQILIVLIAITGFSNILGMQILIPTNREKSYMFAVICGAIADFVLNLFLIPSYAAIGAAIATLIAELVQFTIQIIVANKDIKQFFDYKSILKVIFACLISSIIIFIEKPFLNFNPFITLCISGITFFGIYAIIIWIEDLKIFTETINQLTKGKIKR